MIQMQKIILYMFTDQSVFFQNTNFSFRYWLFPECRVDFPCLQNQAEGVGGWGFGVGGMVAAVKKPAMDNKTHESWFPHWLANGINSQIGK
jgi:hypothetical protein